MKTFEITYENGATNRRARASGASVYEAIVALGFRDAHTFMAMRVVTWKEV